MSPISVNSGDSLPPVMVVEYLRLSMSKDLLCMFPDNSAFDFDYAQSSIWSPMLPPNSSAARGLELSRRLSYGDTGDHAGLQEITKKMAKKLKRKFTDYIVENVDRCSKTKKRKRKPFGFSPARSGRRLSSASSSPKAWAKVMNAALKQFKKMKNNNKNQNVHLHLSNCFTS